MKKLLLLFAVLLSTMGAWAQNQSVLLKDYESKQVFKLKNKATGLYLSVETAKANEGLQIKNAVDEDKQDFFFIPTPSENIYFIQCASGEFIRKVSPWHAKTETQPTAFEIQEVNPGEYKFYNKNNQAGHFGPNKQGAADGSPIYSNHTNDNPNTVWILELSSVTSDVLANAESQRELIVPDPREFPTTQAFKLKNPNGHYMEVTISKVNDGITVKASADNDNQKFFVFQSSESDGYFLQCANLEGIKVVPGWYAQSNTQEASLLQIEQPALDTYRFKSTLGYIGVNENGSDNGDGSKEGAIIYSNQRTEDPNIAWKLEFAEIDDDIKEEVVEKQQLYNSNYHLSKWKDYALSHLGYVGAYPKSMRSEIEAISTYADAKTFDNNNQNRRISLTSGYYFIKGTGTGNNANWYVTYSGNENKDMKAVAQTPGVNHIFKFVADADKYKLMSCNTGLFVGSLVAAPSASQIASPETDGKKYEFVKDNNGCMFSIKDEEGNFMRTEPSGNNAGNVNFWNDAWGSENDEKWYIIHAAEFDITIGDAGYATTHLPFDVTLPNNLKAYAVTATAAESATLTEMIDIPANEGAILKADKGTYTLAIATASSDWKDNMLEGTNVDEEVEGPGYVLSMPADKEVGLYSAALTGGKFKNNANKAYLPAREGNAARFFVFDFGGTETGIVEIENGNVNTENTVVYDLAGRRVQKAQKGLYIVNGKKVIK